jgi:phage gpG-like protein
MQMTLSHNAASIIARLKERLQKLQPNNEIVKTALVQAGIIISGEAKLNIRRQGLIDTGRLLNSLRYEVEQDNVKAMLRVGSFGVPYAAVHEFGYRGTVNIRGHRRLMVKVFGKPVDPREIDVKPHSRFVNIPERAYLRPAVQKHLPRISELLREAVANG